MSNKGLKFCTWNVNGLRAIIKKGELANFLDKGFLIFNIEKPHFLCLNEIKMSKDIIPEIENVFPKKYFQYYNTSEEKKGYSGVCTLSSIKPITATFGIKKKSLDTEGKYIYKLGRVLTLEYDTFYLINVYVPNSGQVFYVL